MARLPSEKTQLANARRTIRELLQQRSDLELERNKYRIRATQAEQEAAEWKQRFDKLLERTPRVTADQTTGEP